MLYRFSNFLQKMSTELAENGMEQIGESETLMVDEGVEVNADSNDRNPDDNYDENLNAQDHENEENLNRKLCQFPLARVKKIMKSDPEIPSISQEALFLITKSMEMFIESFSNDVHDVLARSKGKTLKMDHVKQVIDNHDYLTFLEGVFDD